MELLEAKGTTLEAAIDVLTNGALVIRCPMQRLHIVLGREGAGLQRHETLADDDLGASRIFLIVLCHLKMDVLRDGPPMVTQDVVNRRVVRLLAAEVRHCLPREFID